MPVQSVHTAATRARTYQALSSMVVAYRLPLIICLVSMSLVGGYNVFFACLLLAVRGEARVRWQLLEAAGGLQVSPYTLHHTTTHNLAVVSLLVGNVLFIFMYWSFARAIFTCAGYVPAEPWQRPPDSDAARRHALQVTWTVQRQRIRDQGAAARQAAARAQATPHAWWAPQLLAPSLMDEAVPPMHAHGHVWSSDAHDGGVAAAHRPLVVPSDARGAVRSPLKALTRTAEASTGDAIHIGSSLSSSSSSASPSRASSTDSRDTQPSRSGSSAVVLTARVSPVHDAAALLTASPLPALPPLCVSPTTGSGTAVGPHVVAEYEADGSLRYCAVCRQYKPDGSHHCRACERCVFDMDHHCAYLNNCVGRRNYKFFFLCLLYAALCGTVNSLLFTVTYTCSLVCRGWGSGWWLVPAGMCAIGVCVAYLLVQHVFLLLRGRSTLERMADVTALRFLLRVGASRRGRLRRPGGCADDCAMAVGECARAVGCATGDVAAHTRSGSTTPAGGRSGSDVRNGVSTAPPSPTRAERRAQRFELLFGRPRWCLLHVLPFAPSGGRRPRRVAVCEAEEAASGEV